MIKSLSDLIVAVDTLKNLNKLQPAMHLLMATKLADPTDENMLDRASDKMIDELGIANLGYMDGFPNREHYVKSSGAVVSHDLKIAPLTVDDINDFIQELEGQILDLKATK